MKDIRAFFPKKGIRAMRKGNRFGGLDGDKKGLRKYFNRKLRHTKNEIDDF